jgi:hypothetical protein
MALQLDEPPWDMFGKLRIKCGAKRIFGVDRAVAKTLPLFDVGHLVSSPYCDQKTLHRSNGGASMIIKVEPERGRTRARTKAAVRVMTKRTWQKYGRSRTPSKLR